MVRLVWVGLTTAGIISCLGVILSAMESPIPLLSISSKAANSGNEDALDANEAPVDSQLINDAIKLTTKEDTPFGFKFDDIMTQRSSVRSSLISVHPSHGILELSSSQTGATYFPDANFNGNDTFSLHLILGIGYVEIIPVEISVAPVNDSPEARFDSILIAEHSITDLEVLENDHDVDGDPMTIVSISDHARGLATISDDGQTILYEAPLDDINEDSFSYTIADPTGASSSADIFLTIFVVNDKPVAQDDLVTGKEDSAIHISALSNDYDVDNDDLEILSVTKPSKGSAEISRSGKIITYYPFANLYGTDEFEYKISDGSLTDTATVKIVVEPVNDPPEARAGRDITAMENSRVVLDGSASLDVDGSIVSYKWVQSGNSTVSRDLLKFEGKIVEFIAPSVTSTVDLFFTLTIEDDGGQSSSDVVRVTVINANRVPTADAGIDQAAKEHDLIWLNGSKSFDPDGDALRYSWKQDTGPEAVIDDKDSVKTLLHIPSVSKNQTLTFTLRVVDTDGQSDEDSVAVFVVAINDPPVADARRMDSVEEGSLVELDGSGSFDPDGASLSYFWKQLEGTKVSLSSANSVKSTFRAPYDLNEDETLIFELRVSDGTFFSTDTVAITVRDSVTAPKLLGTPHYLRDLVVEISQAEDFVYASTYFVQDYSNNRLLDALENATKRGVEVRLIFAEQTLDVYHDIEERLTERGIAYKIVTSHAKVTVIDNKLVYVGSANWNKNGLENNWELSIKLNNPDTVREAKRYVEALWKTGAKIETYSDYPDDRFANGREFYDILMEEIGGAEKIKLLMFQAKYNFADPNASDSKLMSEINKAHKRQADLQLLFDDPTYYEIYGGKQYLTRNNIPHKVDDKTSGNLERLHAKAVLIDDEVLFIGSHNWNSDSLESPSEASIVTRDPEIISAFLDIFEEKWDAGRHVVGG